MKTKKSILFVWYGNIFNLGGIEKFTIDVGNYISEKYKTICICKKYLSKINTEYIKRIKINFTLISHSKSKLAFYIKNNILLFSLLIKEKNLREVYLITPSLIFSILTLIPIKKINIILGNHMFFPKIRYLKDENIKAKRPFFHIFSLIFLKFLIKIRLLNKKRIKIHALNRTHLKIYKSLGFQNIYLIPNYVETEKVRDIVNSKEFIVTYVGRIAKDQKGIDVLLEVIKRTLDKNRNIKFYIAGKGEKEWEDKLKELENIYSDNVKYLGFINEEEKYDFLSKSSLFIAPSRWKSGVPTLSVGEALSEGNICLLSNISEFYDILKFDKKFGFICKDIEDYVNKILELYDFWKSDREKFLEWRKYIQKRAIETFSLEKIAKEFEEKLLK